MPTKWGADLLRRVDSMKNWLYPCIFDENNIKARSFAHGPNRCCNVYHGTSDSVFLLLSRPVLVTGARKVVREKTLSSAAENARRLSLLWQETRKALSSMGTVAEAAGALKRTKESARKAKRKANRRIVLLESGMRILRNSQR
jgi:hypothetical protein